eukprot:6793777-Alexandrium_andersonii.AAC.1
MPREGGRDPPQALVRARPPLHQRRHPYLHRPGRATSLRAPSVRPCVAGGGPQGQEAPKPNVQP